jgi:uncharacterized protein YfaP (DUF2135 family)
MKGPILAGLFVMCGMGIAVAGPVPVSGAGEQELFVEINWSSPVDLDLFLTDPAGETVYFANRKARSGVQMGKMTGCKEVAAGRPPFVETVSVPHPVQGTYRVSVDYIKDCGASALQVDFNVRLVNAETMQQLAAGHSTVKYRLLDTVGWEFEIK